MAQRKQARGADPEPDRLRALEINRRCRTCTTASASCSSSRRWAPPRPDAIPPRRTAAEAAARRSVKLTPDQSHGHGNLGDVMLRRAMHQHRLGLDPWTLVRQAESSFARAAAAG
jgi:hypothetical protein